MGKAFTVCFPSNNGLQAQEAVEDKDMQIDGADDVDNPENWEDLPADEMRVIDNMLHANSKNERLSCYCHTLYLTVPDGLGESKILSAAIAKTTKLSSLLYQSSGFKDMFETAFGKNKGIPAAVSTRCNTTLRQIQAVLSLDQKTLSMLLEKQAHENLILSARE